MLPFPPVLPDPALRFGLRLGRDHYVRVDTCDYSINPRVIGRRIEVRVDLEWVTATCGGEQVACHRRCVAKHRTIIDPNHARELRRIRAEQAPPRPPGEMVRFFTLRPARRARQERRVLVTGGEIRLFGHVRSEDPRLAAWQRPIDTTWRRLGGGCHTSREALRAVNDRVRHQCRATVLIRAKPADQASHPARIATARLPDTPAPRRLRAAKYLHGLHDSRQRTIT